MTQAASLSLQPGVQHSILKPGTVRKELLMREKVGSPFPNGCLVLVLEYAGDLGIVDRFKHVQEQSYKHILNAFRGNALFSRLTVEIPRDLPDGEYEKRVKAIYRAVMELARAEKIKPGVLKILEANPTMTPLRLLPHVLEVAKLVEDGDLVRIFPRIISKISDDHPGARGFLSKASDLSLAFEAQPVTAKAEAIRGFMNKHRNWLEKIKELNLAGLGLSTFPEELTWHTNLEELMLDQNCLTTVPATIGKLTQLLTLDLSSNQLREVPKEIFGIVKLRQLWLQHNQLTAVSRKIGALFYLTLLSLSSNRLTSLPGTIGKLENLRQITLSDNSLTALPGSMANLTKLTTFHLKGNKLTNEVDEVIQSLEKAGCQVYR